jgi:hypothetical protein
MMQRRAVVWQFLEAKDDRVGGGINPRTLWRNLASGGGISINRDGALHAMFDRDADTCGHQLRRAVRG